MKATKNSFVLLICAALILTGKVCFAENVFLDDYFNDMANGRFVIEAEHYSARAEGSEAGWWEVNGSDHTFIEGPMQGQQAPTRRDGSRGNYMEVIGRQLGSISPIDQTYHGPFLEYKVLVDTPGKYRLYVRWKGRNGSTDSLYGYLVDPTDAILVDAGPQWFLYHQYRSEWIWDYRGVKDTTKSAYAGFPHTAVWDISEPGIYTIVIALREADTAIDSLVLQTENLDRPSGDGPIESVVISEPAQLAAARINQVLTVKQKEIERVEKLISSEQMIVEIIEQMLANSNYGDLGRGNLVAAKAMVESSIQQEQKSKLELEKSVMKLEEALRKLGWNLNADE